MVSEDVSLTVDGYRLRGFQDCNVTRSAEEAAITFALKCSNPSWSAEAQILKRGAIVRLEANGTLLCTGPIDDYDSSYGERESREVTVNGRSKGADAIDCPPAKHKTGRIENKTLLDAAKELDEFGVDFRADVPLKTIRKIQREPGHSVFETLEHYAKAEGILLVGQPDGGILLTRAGTKRHAGRIALGAPGVIKISVKFSAKGKNGSVEARGQSHDGADLKALRKTQTVYDPDAGRYRPAIVYAERDLVDTELKRRADWKRVRQQGSSVSATVTLAGWRDEAGEFWTPGKLIAVTVEPEGLDQDLAVSSVTFNQSAKETKTELTLVDPKSLGGKSANGKSAKGYNTKPLEEEG